uniref:FAM91 C-terminal domain-containing protein n=1 Tax=Hucho hucho TaxID=62062 RepID=A0A4W5JJ81_9TELE
MLNDALTHSAVLIQGHGLQGHGETVHVPFPFDQEDLKGEFSSSNMCVHKALLLLREKVDLEHQCGYITMLNPNNRHRRRASESSNSRGDSHLGGGLEANSSTESFELVTEDNNGGKQAAEGIVQPIQTRGQSAIAPYSLCSALLLEKQKESKQQKGQYGRGVSQNAYYCSPSTQSGAQEGRSVLNGCVLRLYIFLSINERFNGKCAQKYDATT